MLEVPYVKLAAGVLASGWKNARQLAHMANAFKAFRLAAVEGDNERGVLPLGQVAGLVDDLPTVAEVVARIVAQAEEVQSGLATLTAAAEPEPAGADRR